MKLHSLVVINLVRSVYTGVQDEMAICLIGHMRRRVWAAESPVCLRAVDSAATMYNQLLSRMPEAVSTYTTSKINSYEF